MNQHAKREPSLNIPTHFLASWFVARGARLDLRSRIAVTWAGVAPDLDGLGVAADLSARLLHLPSPELYVRWHHVLLHGAAGSLLLAVLAATFAHTRRALTFAFALLASHLHLVCDLMGSRGPGAQDYWTISYLSPFSDRWTWWWTGQWALNAWQNLVIMLVLLGGVGYLAVTKGEAPSEVFGSRVHSAFVATLKARWLKIRRDRWLAKQATPVACRVKEKPREHQQVRGA